MKRQYLNTPPSDLTGPLRSYLLDVQRVLNGLPVMSLFSGTDPNSRVSGLPGDLTVNIGSATTANRLWILGGGDQSKLTTQGWVVPAGGGGSSGTQSSGTSVTATTDFVLTSGSSNVTIALSTTGVTPGAGYNTFTVDDKGRLTAASITAGGSGNSLFWTSNISAQVTGSNVTLDLPRIIAAGSGCSVSYDSTGRVTAAATSITTVAVTGVWTSGISSSDIQGLGSTWTVSRISSALSILGNEIWASGFSGSLGTFSRVSSAVSILANEVWASVLSAPSQRSLLPGTGISLTDAGPNNTLTVNATGGPGGSGITFWEAMSFVALYA